MSDSDDSDTTTNNDRQEDQFQTSSTSGDDQSNTSQNESTNKLTKSSEKKMTISISIQPDQKLEDDERKKSVYYIDEQQILRRKHRLLSKLEQIAQCIESKLPQQENNLLQSGEAVQIYRNNSIRKSERCEVSEKSVHFSNNIPNKDKENLEYDKRKSIISPQHFLEQDTANQILNNNDNQRKDSKRATLSACFVKTPSTFAESAKNYEKEEQKSLKQLKERETIYNINDPKVMNNTTQQNPQPADDKAYHYYQAHNQNNYLHYPHNYMTGQTFKQFDDKEKFDQFDYFDQYKEYSKFFPHNNISKVLDKMKIQIQVHKKSKLKSPTNKLTGRIGPDLKALRAIRKMNIFIIDDLRRNGIVTYNPTSISYGIGQKGQNPSYPIRKL